MNFPTRKYFFTVLAALWLLPSVAALAESRWLLVFNTSSAMKKRLPAVEAEVRTLLLADFSRSLRADDGLGVWTLNDKLHTGQLPLITWSPETASSTVSNLVAFVHRQSYSGSTSFAALQPLLDQVIADSERLTVVIICDGEDEIHGTPYDDGLNDTIKQTRDARKNLHQPFVIVLRTQMGKFTGATVNFPPVPANLPPFPLLPREIKAATPAPPTNIIVVKPPPVAPLIIVGTHVSTDTNDVPKPPPPPPTNPVVAAVVKINPPPVTNPSPKPPVVRVTNVPPVIAVVTNAPATATETNIVAAVRPADDTVARHLTYVAAGIIALALLVIVFTVRARRTPPSSLITSSLESDSRPPPQK